MFCSSSEGFCREGLLAAILFREADMVGYCYFLDDGGLKVVVVALLAGWDVGGKVGGS